MTAENDKKKIYRVLLLAAPIGSGHILAAQALQQELERRKDVEVVQGDVFSFFPAALGRAFLRCYLWVLAHCPWLYAASYRWGNRSQGGGLWLRALVNGVLARLGAGFLERVRPDAVLATHATPAGIISIYKKRHPEAQVFLGAVVTDFSIHRWWLNDGVDTYFVADERLRERLPANADVKAYGIPIRSAFCKLDRAAVRQALGWSDEERVCLVMGGGEGLLPMEELLRHILRQRLAEKLRLVFLTGRNKKLAARLKKLAAENKNVLLHPEICGFREDAPQLMAAADVVVTKAGGLTLAEVLASGCSYIIYKPLPGQERNNAAFLQRYCGARVCGALEELAHLVLSANYGEKDGAYYGRPQAAAEICSCVLQRLESRRL